jgi:hypothetical protein
MLFYRLIVASADCSHGSSAFLAYVGVDTTYAAGAKNEDFGHGELGFHSRLDSRYDGKEEKTDEESQYMIDMGID